MTKVCTKLEARLTVSSCIFIKVSYALVVDLFAFVRPDDFGFWFNRLTFLLYTGEVTMIEKANYRREKAINLHRDKNRFFVENL